MTSPSSGHPLPTVQSRRFPYPRRRAIRAILQQLTRLAFALLTDLEILGQETLPASGPLLVVANHFHFTDPVLMVRVCPWPLDFLGGLRMPNAPAHVTWIPKLWGFYPVQRGGFSRQALRAGEAVLAQDGVLGIFPEAGNWATVLRPARPGAAFLAVQTAVPILPMGFDGLTQIFPALRQGRRARVTARIGRPFGPFHAPRGESARRPYLEEIGHEIMRRIAELLPPGRRGHYSDDPTIRAAALGSEVYPWDQVSEVRSTW